MSFEINLLALNSRGIFPGPAESPENFLRRGELSGKAPQCKAFELTKALFDAAPDWVEIKQEAKGLLPWEGAATWIEENADGQKISAIQLKPSLPSFYSLDEVLAHELVHAMRVGFEESRFEEVLAYQTSKSKFRRYFGPIFSKTAEVKGFIFLMLVTWLLYWTELVLDVEWGGAFFFGAPSLALGWGVFRLMRTQKVFSNALRNLEQVIAKPGKSLAVALRLTDAEIAQFAKSSTEEIVAFVKKETSLRWRQLSAAYFEKS
jgi:hypothetical protein